MGAMNTEDNYRVRDYQDEIDKQRQDMHNQHIAEMNELRCMLKEMTEERDKYKSKCSDTHKDSVIKELEHKLGRANEKISLLKRLAKVFMEEL
jgi:2-oxoglutarate dehydrogenase complex dehydrogenase (E1) component-like enzyme